MKKKIVDGDIRGIDNPQMMWLSEVGLAQFHAVHTYSRIFFLTYIGLLYVR